MARTEAAIEKVAAAVYTIPTDAPESDGTFEWTATTLVLSRVAAAGEEGIGYSYADAAAARVIEDLAPLLVGRDALATNQRWRDMMGALRNAGRPGIGAMAVSAVDVALWDLKARLLSVPLVTLLGAARASVPVYGSGGFTSYTPQKLSDQLSHWAEQGMTRVKMKVGRHPGEDPARVACARSAIGDRIALFVDANGAYTRKEALRLAEAFARSGVAWFEEPVSADDLAGLRLLRDRVPAGMDVAAGEYGFDAGYFRRMLAAGAVDVLQADATRCGGVTGFLAAAALAEAFQVPLSSHCAPSLHLPLMCWARAGIHIEYFHDHARIEHMLFDGAPNPLAGCLSPALDRPGLGLEFKEAQARCYRR